MKKASLGFVLAAVAMATAAQAQGLRLGIPSYGGTGCPGGTVSTTLSPDEAQLSVLFDNYVAMAPNSLGQPLDRKSCNVSIPVTVPNGYSVAVFQVDYRGYVSVPSGGNARFNVEYFFAGQRGPIQQKTFYGPADDNYFLQSNLVASALVWSACSAQTNLRINTSMIAQSNARRQQVLATLDSVDVNSGLVYHLAWRRCR